MKLLEGKKNWHYNLNNLPVKESIRVWFHCASLGEFEQGRPVIEGLKMKLPDLSVIITFFSPSGYEIRKDYPLADLVLYMPWDTRRNAKEFYDSVNPDFIVFIKYEFWLFFLEEGAKRNIPSILISGIFRPSQLFFRWYGSSYRKVLDCFKHLFVQNQESMDLLISIGITNTTLSGDTRFDRVKEIAEKAEIVDEIEEFSHSGNVMVAGSVWKEDLERIIPLINDPELDMKYIIAPHEINSHEIESWRILLQPQSILFSEIHSLSPSVKKADVLIIDNIGLLSRLYRYGSFAFIGGAYGPGLHNTLEAVAFGIPVFFGNKSYRKYQEALDLIELNVAFPVDSAYDLKTNIEKFNSDKNLYSRSCKNALEYINQKSGATYPIVDYVVKKTRDL